MDWLAIVVGACSAPAGSSEFYKTRRKGNQVLVVQRCYNKYGHFLMLFEYDQEVRNGFIAVLEGSMGKGWIEVCCIA